MKHFVFYGILLGFSAFCVGDKNKPPNIILILADDMGSNDVSYRGSNQFMTPNIDALGYNGVILNRHYTEAICTPSRAALMTGQYPIKLRMQGTPLGAGSDGYLPVGVKTLPQVLKEQGYSTHLVGKWHLGSARRRDTPTERGFDSHFGYWNGYVSYFDYNICVRDGPVNEYCGFDLKNNFVDSWGNQGTYAIDLFTEKALDIIERQNDSTPLFLMLSHLAVHTGKNDIVEVKDEKEMNERFGYIEDLGRRRYADSLSRLDNSVGQVVKKLQQKNMLENSVVIFMSDNGAPTTIMMGGNGGSNYPLRGEKFSLHEGGIRNVALLYSPLLEQSNYINDEFMHITDWLPTLYRVAGGNVSSLTNLDGLDQWHTISQGTTSPREEILLNIDEVQQYSGIIESKGRYKLLNGTYASGVVDHYSPDAMNSTDGTYNVETILNSTVNSVLEELMPNKKLDLDIIEEMRNIASSVRRNKKCIDSKNREKPEICHEYCLFDLLADPCETENLIKDETKTELVKKLKNRLHEFWGQVVPQFDHHFDTNSNPNKYNGTWCTWLENDLCVKTPNFTIVN